MIHQIELVDPQSKVDGRIIKAQDVQAYYTAAKIVENAHKWSQSHKKEMCKVIAVEKERAIIQGHADGIAQFQAAAHAYDTARMELMGRVEEIVSRCLFRVFKVYPARDVLEKMLAPVFESIAPSDDLRITAHPDHLEDITSIVRSYNENTKKGCDITITPKDDMEPNTCLIYSSSEVIDVSVSVLVNQMIKAMSVTLYDLAPKSIPLTDEDAGKNYGG